MEDSRLLAFKSYYTPAKNYWFPAFLSVAALEKIWGKDGFCAEVSSWSGEPLERWFSKDRSAIMLGCARYSDGSISFSNGRHRTRWMMQLGLEYVPVCIAASDYYQAMMDGLISHRAFDEQSVGDIRLKDLSFAP